MSDNLYEDHVDNTIEKKVLDEFFRGATIKYNRKRKISGQIIDEDGIPIISPWAGPDANLAWLFHEMGHFAEIDDERMCIYGWGLKLRQVYINGRGYDEPLTMESTLREIRVIAYEMNLIHHFNCPETVEEIIKPLKYMADFTFVPLEDGRDAWDWKNEKFIIKDMDKREASKLKWIADRVKEQMEVFTFDRFVSEWWRKNEILKCQRD